MTLGPMIERFESGSGLVMTTWVSLWQSEWNQLSYGGSLMCCSTTWQVWDHAVWHSSANSAIENVHMGEVILGLFPNEQEESNKEVK